MNLRPTLDRVIVRQHEGEETTLGGIVIAQPKPPRRGTVLAVGPGRRTDDGRYLPISVAVGDVVEWQREGGMPLRVGDDEYVVLGEPEILGVVTA